MSDVPSRHNWFNSDYNILDDKEALLKQTMSQMLNKTLSMFRYKNLPDTIKEKDLELLTQLNGFSVWAKVEDSLYVFYAGLGGKPNPYYLPTIAVIANPALNYNATLKIDKDCVVMLNDYLYQGMKPLFNKYGRMLVEAELSLKWAIINARIPALIQADNDNAKASAEAFFNKIVEAKEYGIISSNGGDFFEGIKSQDFYKQPYIKDLIESIQYIKGSWYNELGLNSTFNMKREAINEAEATLNEDILYPTIDTMLQCRKNALEKINKMFGTNIEVELNSSWEQNKKHEKLVLKQKQAEVDLTEQQAENGGESGEDTGNVE